MALVLKRLMDLLISIPLCILLSPLFLLITILIKIDSPGPAFFVQARRGKGFKLIKIVKFRSLIHNAPDPHAKYEMLEQDPRITRVGNFLRKTSLDELPQLFNIIAGTMSLVGPRPLVEWESQASLPQYAARFDVKPGITGLSQLSGRNTIDFNARCEKDIEYVNRWNLVLDLKLLLKTPFYIMRLEGIYPQFKQ
jgi:undecaprenyl phosphate N,N'-diacetylbacillosamine 1-phosphate transferase